ncbi:hypothetical protein [Streptomyces sp. NPDC051567]|uniref:hypothetical protein n=1 Tax=Streptomyces sp. NPDC051567 TaxID=3365660 RepID=UPI0037B3A387
MSETEQERPETAQAAQAVEPADPTETAATAARTPKPPGPARRTDVADGVVELRKRARPGAGRTPGDEEYPQTLARRAAEKADRPRA